ncbi:hypothetical protein [Streptomyces sp. NPDC054849]
MHTTSTSTSTSAMPPAQAHAAGRDRSRFRAVLSAALFVPSAVVAGLLTLASERASRCVTYGEQCSQGLPGWLFLWSAGIAAVAFVVAMASAALRVRQVALAAQLLAECAALLVILSYA